jgi:hypothetical protein
MKLFVNSLQRLIELSLIEKEELYNIEIEVSEEKKEKEESLIQGHLVGRKKLGEEEIQKFQFENSGQIWRQEPIQINRQEQTDQIDLKMEENLE